MTAAFLQDPCVPPSGRRSHDEDLADGGYVWNVVPLWAHHPHPEAAVRVDVRALFNAERSDLPASAGSLWPRAASALGDS